jgi:hypothetical protein
MNCHELIIAIDAEISRLQQARNLLSESNTRINALDVLMTNQDCGDSHRTEGLAGKCRVESLLAPSPQSGILDFERLRRARASHTQDSDFIWVL